MTSIIQNSRIYIWLRTLFLTMHNAWQYSALGRLSLFLKGSYEISFVKKTWEGFCGAENTAQYSLYGRCLSNIGRKLLYIGGILEKSILYRIISALKSFYIKITKGSLLFSQINRLNFRQWFLVAFSMYLPLDYIIRSRVRINIVSSLWEEAFILAAVILVLWRKALSQSRKKRPHPGAAANLNTSRATPIDSYILLFMAVGFLLMSAVRPHPYVAVAGYRAVVEYIVWFFLVIRLIEDDKDFKVIFYSILGMGALLSLHGIYQFIIAVPIPASWVSQTEMGVRTRVFSLTGSPNILGSLMVLIAPMAASMIYYCRKAVNKLVFLGVTGAMSLCLLFTFSRGAWVGMVIAVLIFAFYMDKRLLGIMGAVMAAALIFVPSITSRLTYLFTSDYAEASAVGGRALRWVTGRLLLMENNPWTGFGLGRFGGAVAMNNQLLEETEEFSYFYMDNYYLKTMVEMGYIGVAFFLLMMIGLLIWGLRAVYQSGAADPGAVYQRGTVDFLGRDPLVRYIGSPKAMAVGILSGLCGVLTHCYFENIFEEPYMMAYFWGLAAMLMYLGFFSSFAQNASSLAQKKISET